MLTFGFIGTGNMGGALARAARKRLDGGQLLLANRTAVKAEALAAELGAQTVDNQTAAAQATYLFLGVKPQMMAEMLSDIAPVLISLDARVVTTERALSAEEFLCTTPKMSEALGRGEIVTKIEIPVKDGWNSKYMKFRLRDAVDFAIVSVASSIKAEGGVIQDARLVFGGVSPMPRRAREAEEFLKGKAVTEENAWAAADIAVKDAAALQYNAYKIQILRSLVKDSILAVK